MAAPSTTSSANAYGAASKYENIYLNQYDTVRQLQAGLRTYFDFYNHGLGR